MREETVVTTSHPAPTLLQLVEAGREQEPSGSHPHAPEQLLVSALLESGRYDPRSYGVPPSWFHSLGQVHRFCLDYQESEGVAPPVHLVTARFPSFVFTPGIGASWAAHEVGQAETNRTLRKGLTKALQATGDEAYGEAVGIMRDTIEAVTTATRPGTVLTDFSDVRAHADRAVCPIPPGVLANLTGGHGAGQLWLIAALWGVGKTFKLCEHAIAAAEGGWDVVFFSLEMTTGDILARLRSKVLASMGQQALLVDLDTQEDLVARWQEGKGLIEVRGPDRGRVDVSVIAGAVSQPRTLVILDYMAKMYSSDGTHAGSGWEVLSLVSKEVAQTAGWLNVPILGAAQINRQGQLAGTIALEQDADLIVEQKRIGPKVDSVRLNTLVKSRHTALHVPWYSRFDPVGARFDDISGEEAMRLRIKDESLLFS